MTRFKIELRRIQRLLSTEAGDKIDGWRIVETTPGSPHAIIELPDDWDASRIEQEMERLRAEGTIVDDGNGLYRPEYTDYHILDDWLEGSGFRTSTAVMVAVGDTYPTESIRGRGGFGAGIRVGIVDTGLDKGHVAFDGKTVYGHTTDDHGHGTHVASTASSTWGIASDAEIYMINALPGGSGTESGIAAAIRSVADNDCKVISLSLGGSGSGVIDAAMDYASSRGSVTVAAAGNTHNAPIGSPARRAHLIVLACDREGVYTEWTSGPEWNNPNRCTAVGKDIAAAARGTRDGVLTMSGTSMATPQIAGMVALLLAAGETTQRAVQYILEHRFPPPTVGRVQMQEDFGGAPVETPGDLTPVFNELIAIQQECDRDNLRYTVINGPTSAMTKAELTQLCNDNIAFAADIQSSLGIIYERAQVALDALPKVEPPPVDPPVDPPVEPPVPATLAGVYGTYAGHGLAQDLYGGYDDNQVNWGPHHGIPLVAPVDGRVEVYQFGTPLSVNVAAVEKMGTTPSVYVENWSALDTGWVCRVHPFQTMFVAVFWPSAPMTIAGQRVGHLHYGHVRGDIRTGSLKQGEQFATIWDSGIRFEPAVPNARAAHTHCCAGAGSNLSPNGDLDGRLAVIAQGWHATDIHTIPGPSDYQSGRYCAGRLLTDFTREGHPIPPMPG